MIGTGINAYADFRASQSRASIANHNLALQRQQALQSRQAGLAQAQAAQQQARLMAAQAQLDAAMATAEGNARIANARRIRQGAVAQTAIDRENDRRTRLDQRRFLASQAAQVGFSGTTDAGSPLEAVMATLDVFRRDRDDLFRDSQLRYQGSMNDAAIEQFGGEMQKAGADANLSIGLAEAGLRAQAGRLQSYAAEARHRAENAQARLDYMGGQAASQGTALSAFGGLMSGLGSAYYQSRELQNYQPLGKKPQLRATPIEGYRSKA